MLGHRFAVRDFTRRLSWPLNLAALRLVALRLAALRLVAANSATKPGHEEGPAGDTRGREQLHAGETNRAHAPRLAALALPQQFCQGDTRPVGDDTVHTRGQHPGMSVGLHNPRVGDQAK